MQKAFYKLLIAGAVLALVPLFLRRRCRVMRRTLINAGPEAIFPLLNDFRNWPRWTKWDQLEDLQYSYAGPSEGVGAEQRWSGGRIDGFMRITQSHPDARLAYDLEMGEGRFHLQGIFELEPVGNFTRVTWVCSWVGDSNPYARYLDIVFRRWVARDFEAGLSNLRTLAESGESNTPLPALN